VQPAVVVPLQVDSLSARSVWMKNAPYCLPFVVGGS